MLKSCWNRYDPTEEFDTKKFDAAVQLLFSNYKIIVRETIDQ
jgi:hypothetical protein